MAKGGARPGAGRRKGTGIKPFREYVSEEERQKFVEFILDSYMGDMRLAQWFDNQLFGQAPQSIDRTILREKLPTPLLAHVPTDDGPAPDTKAK
ncbi:hypothetical protein [Nitrobacter hamburgensis]|uniref:hypothetical protein n=1 Tax=Nitrobacter hamburgensis TaxID=912 RepID=UPI00059BBFC7|nr:hypothetical protein [Nitrobacter hamburgensis]